MAQSGFPYFEALLMTSRVKGRESDRVVNQRKLPTIEKVIACRFSFALLITIPLLQPYHIPVVCCNCALLNLACGFS